MWALQFDLLTMLLQWKKKTEKVKAHTLFKAAASIAKLSTKFNNSNNNENADDDEHIQPATEEETPWKKGRDADEEQEL